jgi:glycosyltransferase involved in cell wall biosynthesis
MIEIVYFHRNKKAGYSIERTSHSIVKNISKKYNVIEYYLPYLKVRPITILKNIFFVYKNRSRNGINHFTDFNYAFIGLIGTKSIITVHDLVVLRNARNKIEYVIKWIFCLYLPIKIASRIICVSETTKKDILSHIKTNKITVIYNPLDSLFSFTEKSFNSHNPIILHVGTGWNKNLSDVIKALDGIKCHLRIIGRLNEKYISLLNGMTISYSNVYDLTDENILKEYQNCDIVSFPSIFEGFGMPIIEGQAIGRVVITSNIPPMTEVGGKSVVYVNPFNVESMRNGFLKTINDENLRNIILKRSKENIQKFSLEKITDSYIKLYNDIMRQLS